MSEIIEFEGQFYERTGITKTPEGDELFIAMRAGDSGWENVFPLVILKAPVVWESCNPLREIVRPVSAPPQPPVTDFAQKIFDELEMHGIISSGEDDDSYDATEQEISALEIIGNWLKSAREHPEPKAAAEQAGEPGEALMQMADAITSKLIQRRIVASIDRGMTEISVSEDIAEALAPLLEKARASLIIENGAAEALAAELTRWETTPQTGMGPKA